MITKKKVKQIATKVVNKKAPTLSVANATNAANAANATNLGGLPGAAYQDRVAFTSAQAALAIPAGTAVQILGPLSLTVPAGINFVHVTGASTIAGGATSYVMWLEQDAVCSLAGPQFPNRLFGEYTAQDSMTTSWVFPAPAGVHVYRLCALSGAASSAFTRSLTVETVAVGATGGTTIARPSGGSGADSDNDVSTAK